MLDVAIAADVLVVEFVLVGTMPVVLVVVRTGTDDVLDVEFVLGVGALVLDVVGAADLALDVIGAVVAVESGEVARTLVVPGEVVLLLASVFGPGAATGRVHPTHTTTTR